MVMLVVRALKPVKAKTKGYHDMLCKPIQEDAPPGRRLRMEESDAVKAVLAGTVEMLSPGGHKLVEDAAKAPKKATYKTRVEKPEA